jgi:hypothetical protein
MLKKSTLFISPLNPLGGLIEIQLISKPPLGGLGVKSNFFYTPISLTIKDFSLSNVG